MNKKKKKQLQGCLVLLYVSVILEKQAEDRKERESEGEEVKRRMDKVEIYTLRRKLMQNSC